MTAYFESGIFTENKPAWHGLGIVSDQDALTKDEVFTRLPLLASKVSKVPLYGAYFIDGKAEIIDLDENPPYVLVRDFDKKTWGYSSVVSSVYEVLQNDELFDFAQSIVDQSGAIWKTAGTLQDGRVAWGLLQLGDDILVGGEETERVQRYLLVSNTFDKSGGVAACATKVRVVCSNTLAMALNGAAAVYRFRHTGDLAGRMAQAREVLDVTFRHDAAFAELANAWISTPMSEADFLKMVRHLEPMPEEALKSDRVRHGVDDRRSDLKKIWHESPNLQNIAGTKYCALQSVIEWEQHYRYAKRDGESKLLNIIRPQANSYVPQAVSFLKDLAAV